MARSKSFAGHRLTLAPLGRHPHARLPGCIPQLIAQAAQKRLQLGNVLAEKRRQVRHRQARRTAPQAGKLPMRAQIGEDVHTRLQRLSHAVVGMQEE